MAIEIVVADADAHAGLLLAVFAEGDAAHHSFFAEGAIVIVHEEEARRGIAGDVNVGPAVLVKVGGDNGHAVAAALGSDSGGGADIGEGAVSIVAIKGMDAAREPARAALDGNSLPGAIHVRTGLGDAIHVELQIIGDEEIEVAVAVVVDPSAAGAPAGVITKQAGGFGDIAEGAIAVIFVELVLAVVGDEQIFEAVVVVVADANAASPSSVMQAG